MPQNPSKIENLNSLYIYTHTLFVSPKPHGSRAAQLFQDRSMIDQEMNLKSAKDLSPEVCLHALEEERRKMEVFRNDFPISIQLVSQAMGDIQGKLQAPETYLLIKPERYSDSKMGAPVNLVQFIPSRPLDLSCYNRSNDDDDVGRSPEDTSDMSDWLKSAKLWFDDSPINSPSQNGIIYSPAADGHETEQKQQQRRRKKRRCWEPDLHKQFIRALHDLGGTHVATPKQILEIMKVEDLTNDEVKSHLQKYRLNTTQHASTTTTASSEATAGYYGLWHHPPTPRAGYYSKVASGSGSGSSPSKKTENIGAEAELMMLSNQAMAMGGGNVNSTAIFCNNSGSHCSNISNSSRPKQPNSSPRGPLKSQDPVTYISDSYSG